MLPTNVVYDLMFSRSLKGVGSAAALLLLLSVLVVVLPSLVAHSLRRRGQMRNG